MSDTRTIRQGWTGMGWLEGKSSETTREVFQVLNSRDLWQTVKVESQQGPIPRFGTYRKPSETGSTS